MSEVLELYPVASFRDEVAARLRQGIAVRNIKKQDVAKLIGMNQSSFSKRVNGRLPINVDEADEISVAIGLGRTWLLTGEGEILAPDWVPPAGFEPAAFCSQACEISDDTATLGDVIPFPPVAGTKSPDSVTFAPSFQQPISIATRRLRKICR